MKLESPMSSCVFRSMPLLYVILLFSVSLLQCTTNSVSALGSETDRFALLKFKESISVDPYGVLSSWNDSTNNPFCSWPGIECGSQHQRVTSLDLEGYKLQGTISPHIGNLSFLSIINLKSNSFSGEIPQQVGHLFGLQQFDLSDNILEGNIPVNLSYCSQLRILSLRSNRLSGMIPYELGSLVKLEYLSLGTNNLTGGIPATLGNISSLSQFSLAYNNLVGTVPHELGRLKSLTFFAIGPNNLFGTIPLSLYNMSFMNTFSITDNQFNGSLPSNIGLTLPNIESFGIGGNEFSGMIPESFSNASQLQILDLSENNFVGQVPLSLGSLPYIWWLGLSNNNLGNYSANSLNIVSALTNCSGLKILDLSLNNFGGVLPGSVANLSTQLTRLYLGVNQISGNIPETIENLVNLLVLGMTDNLFTGEIPSSLGKLHNLQILDLEWNTLSGKIPPSIGNLTQMFQLYLSHNKLEGSIPTSIVNCQSLQLVDISQNNLSGAIPQELLTGLSSLSNLLNLSRNILTGSIPAEVGKLKNVNKLDLSENHLTNDIPETIGDCQSLEFLYLQGNHFVGSLPSGLASLHGLRFLDLSRNNLSGQIPKDIQKLTFLQYMNLSFNNLEGEVPNGGLFQNTSAVSVVGNSKLCGGVIKLQLPKCPIKVSKQRMTKGLKLAIVITSAAAFFLLLLSVVILYWRRKSQQKPSHAVSTIGFLSQIPYKSLYQATNGFSPSMLIGRGSFGSVYKGILDQEVNFFAVKVLDLQQKGASKSFIAECNALRNIRHRNLVKILTCCCSMDYNGNEFKALVFEYMSNGSLEKWLHPMTEEENRPRILNFIQRLNIVMDVASALYYLHEDCDQPIIHCDLKPSNVLLDDEMSGHISDFGLARLIPNTPGFSESKTSTIGIKGTIGYAAPEYAMGAEPSRKGDVYSYGILVLEIFTGRKPTDEMFKDGFNLHNFVKIALPDGLEQRVDSSILFRELEEEESHSKREDIEIDEEDKSIDSENPRRMSTNLRKCLVSVLNIGLACSEDSPKERMNIGDVTRELERIRNAYIGFETHGEMRQRVV